MFVIKASTPEAMRNEIVKWLNQQASNHRIAASKIAGMHKKEIETARATTYEGAAKFLENCTVESTDVLKIIDDFKMSQAGKFDPKNCGQRGEDRLNAIYDTYRVVQQVLFKS